MKGIILYAPAAVPGGICRVILAPGTAQRAMWNREQSL